MSDLDQPLLDVVSASNDFSEYDGITDADIPNMRPQTKSRSKRRARASNKTALLSQVSRRIFCSCLGNEMDMEGLAQVLYDTGWIVRSQPYGCVYCYRRVPMSRAGTVADSRLNQEMKSSSVSIAADYEADRELEGTDQEHRNTSGASSVPMLTQHTFFFDFGCIVCWGCSEAEEQSIVQRTRHLVSDGPSDGTGGSTGSSTATTTDSTTGNTTSSTTTATTATTTSTKVEEDDMTFVTGTSLKIRNDEVTLASTNPIEKFAISLAFAQSTKLTVDEQNVDKVIVESRAYPEELSNTGAIPLTQRAVAKKIGELFIVRYKIFLDSQMLATPEFFWESDEYEPVYIKARKYLDIDKRMNVLQQRLDVVRELLDMLANALENEHANRLEWIIVVLIVVEVGIQILFGIVDVRCFIVCPN